MASPAMIWLARSVTTVKAKTAAMAVPTRAATAMATVSAIQPGASEDCDVQNAVTAPISIMASTPRFITPLRSAKSSPSPASTSGVP